jgi:multiple sugar transport system permease protein
MLNSTTPTRPAPAVKTAPVGEQAEKHISARRPEFWLTHGLLILVSITFILPLVWMIATSLKTSENAISFPPTFIPMTWDADAGRNVLNPQWLNYVAVWRNPKMAFALFTHNTLVIALLSVIGQTLSCAIVAYGFAKIDFKGKGWLFALMLSTMMLPGVVTLVPMFTIYRFLGDHNLGQWLGTFNPLWVPAWFAGAFNVFLLRQFYMTLPKELSEAARIDGCSEFGIFWRIILPLARPALSVVALFTFMGAWKDFMGPLVYIQDQSQYTLSLGLQTMQSAHGGTTWNMLMAASLLVVAPVIVLFFVTQKQFIQGIATTGMKG